MDSSPVLAITGQVPRHMIGRDAFQETDVLGLTLPITKHSCLIRDAAELADRLREAIAIATEGRPGPVLVDVPKDVQNQKTEYRPARPRARSGGESAAGATAGTVPRDLAERVRAAAQLIATARRPLLMVGHGVIVARAYDEVRRLAEKTGMPVITTLLGISAFPECHPLHLGMPGMHGEVHVNRAIQHADLIVGIGLRFDDRVTGNPKGFAPRAQIIHVDIDASEINKNKAAHIALNCDVKKFLEAILPRLEPGDYRDWRATIDAWRASDPMQYEQRDDVILPQYVIDLFSRLTNGEFVMSTGVGQHQMWAAQWSRFKRPRTWITSGGLGSMGFGLPAAMGAAAGCPGRLIVDIDGDGSFLMNIQELATCYCENLPVKVIVLNNQHLGMVVQWEDRFHAGNRAHTYLGPVDHPEAIGQGAGDLPEVTYPDFVTLAKGFGIAARQIRHKAEVEDALKELIAHPGPYVLDVLVPYQEHVLPMIPAGGTVRDIIKS
jgi:acetolactate synthase-1/2/3 large subunit